MENSTNFKFTFKVLARRIFVISMASVLPACSIMQKKIDPNFQIVTESGFSFQFPMHGEWYNGETIRGQYLVGKKPLPDGSTTLAVVRHGPIWTPGGKEMTSSELFDRFQKDIEADSRGGRANKVQTKFLRKKQNVADCLFFNQLGEDDGLHGAMNLSNDGMICLHPMKKYNFIWMAISQRVPLGKSVSDLTDDKKRFFDSLHFL